MRFLDYSMFFACLSVTLSWYVRDVHIFSYWAYFIKLCIKHHWTKNKTNLLIWRASTLSKQNLWRKSKSTIHLRFVNIFFSRTIQQILTKLGTISSNQEFRNDKYISLMHLSILLKEENDFIEPQLLWNHTKSEIFVIWRIGIVYCTS